MFRRIAEEQRDEKKEGEGVGEVGGSGGSEAYCMVLGGQYFL